MIDSLDISSMTPTFIGYGCMLLALLFWFVWPKAKAKPYRLKLSWPGYILHYFHPLAWVFLSLAAFTQARDPIVSAVFAALGGIVYLIFLVILVKA